MSAEQLSADLDRQPQHRHRHLHRLAYRARAKPRGPHDYELVIAGTGNEAAQVYLLRRLIGAKIRNVSGYAGGGAMNLAIQRGEIDGRCSYSWEAVRASVPEWIRDKKAKPIVQFALTRHAELPDVPLIMDYAKTELDRQALRLLLTREQFGFPLAAPPGVLPEVRDMLRTAFATR